MAVATVVIGVISVTGIGALCIGLVLYSFCSAYVRSFKRGCRESGIPPLPDKELWKMAIKEWFS